MIPDLYQSLPPAQNCVEWCQTQITETASQLTNAPFIIIMLSITVVTAVQFVKGAPRYEQWRDRATLLSILLQLGYLILRLWT